MINIQFSDTLDLPAPDQRRLEAILEQTGNQALITANYHMDADLTLLLGTDTQIQELNRDFLGIDEATDVLSFPNGEIDPETGKKYAGDMIISYPRAVIQAAAGGHSIEAELQLLMVHGVLHLCGFDHDNPEAKTGMWQKQSEILKLVDCQILGPSPDRET